MKEVSVYIHIPFCIRKCYYCDFLSGPADDKLKLDYIKAVCRQIELTDWKKRVIRSIFIGGGTPTVLPSFCIEQIIGSLKEAAAFVPDCEISMEANPGTVDYAKLRGCRSAGVNRLSLGLQSADDGELKALGRLHTYGEFVTAYELARKAGLDNLNIDLISSIPGQTFSSFQRTLQKAVAFRPEHLSVYSLILEEGTELYRRRDSLVLPDEDTECRIDDYTREYLLQNNYMRYEISNYAAEGKECRHNCVYWRRGTYLGFGAGAASLIEDDGIHERYSVIRDVAAYTERLLQEPCLPDCVITDRETLSVRDRMEEFMYLGLRMTRGVGAGEFKRVFGVSIEEIYGGILCSMMQKCVIGTRKEEDDTFFFLTERGMDVSNVILADFLLS